MNDLYQYLYRYIMETKHRELAACEEYRRLKEERNTAENTLEATLTKDQQAQFQDFIEKYNAEAACESEHVFEEALALLGSLFAPGSR